MSIVIDGKGHVEGRLAGVVAKQLLNGKKIVVLRAEQIVTNGDHRFNYHKFRRFLHKTTNTNPRDGPFHQRAPSEMFLRSVRGMINYKTERGAKAFANLKVFEGIPEKYESAKKLVVPAALRIVTIREDRPVTSLGKLATTFGWKYGAVVRDLEAKRAERIAEAHKAHKEALAKRQRAVAAANKELGEAAVRFLETYTE